MTIYYADAQSGDDGNDGLSWGTAKATAQAACDLASAGDEVRITGLFQEEVVLGSAHMLRGVGRAEVDGQNLRDYGVEMNHYGVIANVTVRRCLVSAFSGRGRLRQCRIFESNIGVQPTYPLTLEDCLVAKCTWGLNGTARSVDATNCTFVENDIGVRWPNGSGYPCTLSRCVFRNAVNIDHTSSAWSGAFANTDHNVFDFSYGKNVSWGVDKTSLADWQASAYANDAHSFDRDLSIDLGDPENVGALPTPASWLLTGYAGSLPMGLDSPAVTVSNNRNASLWTGGVFSNTEIAGNGKLVLSAGENTGTYQTDVIDFGENIPAKQIGFYAANEDYPSDYVTMRVRGSADSFVKTDDEVTGPTWVTVPRYARLSDYMSNALRYWQIELTLTESP